MITASVSDTLPPLACHPEYRKDPVLTMKALEWHGDMDVRVVERPRPMVTEPRDALIRITSTTICGSDLHLYHKEFSGLFPGDILGHECMGIVEDIGTEVKDLKKGDRVVVSAVIMCGECEFCKKGAVSCCNRTNPNKEIEKMYGDRLAGIFGYSHLLGGYDGGQAEYVRVPLADLTCLKIPENLRDEQVLFLSDIACTGWHANELGEVTPGKTVAIWGVGPVGLMATMWAKFRGASRIIVVDKIQYRLDLAKKLGATDIIDFTKQDVYATMRSILPHGPDVAIEAVGFRFPKQTVHTLERTVGLETDAPSILNEIFLCLKKTGNLAIVGDYYAYANHFAIGPMMEKGITVRGSQVYIQKYWKQLLEYIIAGQVDLTWVCNHTMKLEEADKGYAMFDKNQTLKILLKTNYEQAKS